jgi:hypothetical protein
MEEESNNISKEKKDEGMSNYINYYFIFETHIQCIYHYK